MYIHIDRWFRDGHFMYINSTFNDIQTYTHVHTHTLFIYSIYARAEDAMYKNTDCRRCDIIK